MYSTIYVKDIHPDRIACEIPDHAGKGCIALFEGLSLPTTTPVNIIYTILLDEDSNTVVGITGDGNKVPITEWTKDASGMFWKYSVTN